MRLVPKGRRPSAHATGADAVRGIGDAATAAGVRWDLGRLYGSVDDPRIAADLAEARRRAERFAEMYRGRVVAAELGGDELRDALVEYEAILQLAARPAFYAGLRAAEDTQDPAALALEERTHEAQAELRAVLVFLDLELGALADDAFDAYLDAPVLAAYAHHLRSVRRFKPHLLSESEERALARKDVSGRAAFVQLYDELAGSLRFPITIAGDTRELSDGEVMALLHHPDAAVRRHALETYLECYAAERLPLTAIFNTLLLDHRIECDMRGYADVADPTHLGNDVDRETVSAMMETVGRRYETIREFLRLKARLLGVPRLGVADVYAPLATTPERIPYDEARAIVLEAFGRFSPLFADAAREFLDGGWVDAEARPGKRSGAFCAALAPGQHPDVLTSYAGTGRDVATLAHEIGHGIHYVLANRQTYLSYDPPLVLAETASVFAEMLVTAHLVEIAPDAAARRRILVESLDEIYGTLFRQHALTRFELDAHAARRDRRLASDDICELWSRVQADLFGDAVEMIPAYRFGWAYIPHFIHSRFYCYAYAFGELLTLALYDRYREEGAAFLPRYLELLASGGGEEPAHLLARFGFDIRSADFWARGCDTVARMIAELRATM